MSISLTSPAIGSTNWGTSVNNNWTAIGNAFSTSAAFSGIVVIGTDPGGSSPLRVGGDVTANTFTSLVSTGTAPFNVSSTTNVANLNASSLNGATFASPGAIGSTTASSGAFTTLSTSSTAQFSGVMTASNTTDTSAVGTAGTVISGGASIAKSAIFGLIAAPSTLALGQLWQDSTQQTWFTNLGSSTSNLIRTALNGTIFTQTATLTIVSSAVQSTLFSTGIGTKTLPANFWTVGKTIKITLKGTFSSLISTAIFFQALYGGVSLGTSTTYTTGSTETNTPITIDILITCRTTGSSGTVFVQGTMLGMNSTAQGSGYFGLDSTAVVTINTTTSNALDVQFKYGASSASNSISITNALIEVIN